MKKSKSTSAGSTRSVSNAKLELYRSLFVARKDAYAVMKGDQIFAQRDPLNNDVLAAHLAGEYRVGTYLVGLDGRTPFLVIDIDVPDRKLVRIILKRLRKLGVSAYVERSKSKGFHIWVFFNKPMRAVRARLFGRLIIKGLESPKIEIFPKQDSVTGEGLGNCIWLPLHGRDVAEGRTIFVDRDFQPIRKQWSLLSTVNRVPRRLISMSLTRLAGAMRRLGSGKETTMIEEYEYGNSFQLKLLSLLIRKPEQVAKFIHARYFTVECYVDIAREVADAYAEQRSSRGDTGTK